MHGLEPQLRVLETLVLPITLHPNIWCAHLDLNQGPNGYEPFATNQLSYRHIKLISCIVLLWITIALLSFAFNLLNLYGLLRSYPFSFYRTMLRVLAISDVRDSAFSKWTLEFSKTIQQINLVKIFTP